MQHSIDLTSKLSFGAQPKGKVTRKEQNATADADGTSGMTAQFSSALNQAMQPKSEPHHTGKTKKAETSEAAADSNTNQTGATTTTETTENTPQNTTENANEPKAVDAEAPDSTDEPKDEPQSVSERSIEFAVQLQTALSIPVALAINAASPSLPQQDITASNSAEIAANTPIGSITPAIASMGDTQMLKPQASTADMAAGSTFAAAMPNIQLAAPAGNTADNTILTAGSTLMTTAEAMPVIPSETSLPEANLGSTADSGLALDSTLTPLTESLSLPQIELPVKGATDGAQAPEIAPLPVSGAGASAAEKAGNPLPEAIDNHLQSLSGLSDQLKALNGEIESVSDEESADFSNTLSEIDTSSATSQTELPAAPVQAGGPTSIQSNLGKPDDPVAQFTSTAAQPTEQVVDGALYSVKNGHKELIIRLNPDNLGEVRINLISHGNQEMSARLIASTRESHELLQSQVDSLKQSLESQGLNVERLSVVLAGSPESTRDFNQQNNQQQTSQHSSQQSGQQQAFNQQGQPNPNLFNQLGGQFQHKQGFAQRPGDFSVGGSATAHADGLTKADTPAAKNDNGRISILA